jgi:FkbM family methyltransferase
MPGGQYGEDKVLEEYFKDQDIGLVVDAGAANGTDGSNSWMLLKRPGWSGVLIEPEPEQFAELSALYEHRHRISTVNCALGTEERVASFYCARQVSTLCPEWRDRCIEIHRLDFKEIQVNVFTLSDVMIDHNVEAIDFLSIDCEGRDVDVLNSLDLERWRPRLICLEAKGHHIDGYLTYCHTRGNTFYAREEEI